MKKKGKKWIILAVCLAAAGAGGTYGIRYLMQNRTKEVEVTAVKDINAGDWISMDYGSQVTGTVVSDVSQQVYVPDDRVIKDVYVSEGDKVRIGDKLVTYDTTLLELDRELQELTVQEIGLELKSAQADLQKLYNTTPVERSSEEEEQLSGGLLDDFDVDDQARMVNGGRRLTASQENKAAEQTEESQAETSADTENTEAVQQPDTGNTEPQQPDTGSTEPQQPDTGSTEPQQPDTGNTEPQQPDTGSTEPQQPDTPSDVLTPGDLEDTSGDMKETEKEEESEKPEEPKLNQSLKKFLWFVRAKEVTAEQEMLLTETKEEQGPDFVIEVSENNIKLIPHFRESAEAQFKEANTYTMLIRGITLEEKISGKLVGTANIDGSDYPEIGGFTLERDQKYESGDVAKLTLMFHEGLTQQQNRGALQDAYAEIELKASEVTGKELIFRVSNKEADDTVIRIEKPQEESEDTTESKPADGNQAEAETESETGSETETETEWETETEPEPETGDETEIKPIEQLQVKITWYHGTNEDALWPDSMDLSIYRKEDTEQTDPILTLENITGDKEVIEDGSEDESESIPDTDEIPEESTEITGAPETEPSGRPEPDVDNSYSTVVWSALEAWPQEYADVTDAENELKAVVLEDNYIPSFEWDRDGSQLILSVKMTYLEPEESPIVKLNPLTELDYNSGVQKKYYKGSGTAEDPYKFFVTDGVRIDSTFVNWVLGFDEAGTTRLNDGFYVILEIRESDTITGAFIRSVGLDGTILTEHGFGPGTYWIFRSDTGIVQYEEEIPDDMGGNFGGDFGGDFGGMWDDMGMTYTAEELAQAIKDKEREIRKLNLDEKEAKLKLKQYEDQMEESTVVSAVNGFVKSMDGDTKSGNAYMVLASEGGLYLKTTVSELDLDKVEKGDKLTATSWETMRMFTASITEINYFPTSTKGDYWSGNVNNSSYPVLAYIDDTTGLSPYEYVGVTFDKKRQTSGSIYLPKAYIRSENGQSYVYKRDENGKLKKQFIRTGDTIYDYVNVKEGVTIEDMLAFPYGKNVKEGAKAVEAQNNVIYG